MDEFKKKCIEEFFAKSGIDLTHQYRYYSWTGQPGGYSWILMKKYKNEIIVRNAPLTDGLEDLIKNTEEKMQWSVDFFEEIVFKKSLQEITKKITIQDYTSCWNVGPFKNKRYCRGYI